MMRAARPSPNHRPDLLEPCMRKFSLLAIAAPLLVLAGCMAEPNAPAAPAPAPTTVEAPATAPAAVPMPADGAALLSPAPVDLGTPAPLVSQACNLEAARVAADAGAAPFSAKAGSVVTFDGWLLAGDGLGAPESAQVRLVGAAGDAAWTAPLALTLPREDVGRTGGNAAGNVGFSQAVTLASLAPGKYRLVLVAQTGGTRAVCDNGRTLSVENG